jgi:hypothetical protein
LVSTARLILIPSFWRFMSEKKSFAEERILIEFIPLIETREWGQT